MKIHKMNKTHYGLLASISITAVFALLLINAQPNTAAIENTSFMTGHFTLIKYTDGVPVHYVQSPNLVVDVGMDTMADLVFDDLDLNSDATDATFSFLEIGTSGTAPAATNTAIGASACARGEDTAVTGTSGVSGEITATIDFAFDGGTCAGGIQEAGVFNAATSESMLARSTFGTITIASGDTLTVTYDIVIT